MTIFLSTVSAGVDHTMDYTSDSNSSAPFNVTVEEWLEHCLGPKHLPLRIVVPLTVVYATLFVSGVFGNLAVCIVIARNAALHTATNYYLFSLAVSDLTLLLLGLPNDLLVYWQQYPWPLGGLLCKVRALVSEMTSYTSVLTIVAFSTERYLAICHPLHSYAMSGLHRAVRIIAVLWLVSFVCASPFAVFAQVNYIDYPPGSGKPLAESAFCAMLEKNIPANWPIYELSGALFFCVPMVVIMVLYVRIGMRIRRRERHSLGKRLPGTVHRRSHSRKAIIRMLSAVVITFFVCWAPFHLQRLLYLYARDSLPHFNTINEWLFYVTGCLYYLSSTANPILYNVMSVKYRKAFRQTLCGVRPHHSDLNSSFR
uniref:Neuropeptide GPCR A25 n=1 Tax=Nilaparvata lugens TaxID=108931 RepID=U3U7N4_NILLU|nr:neuropeptide GPCR A25 [Nilaparvata lugens]